MTKPPYKVPSMAEIEAIPPNGFSIVSTFSGCGGSCLGFRIAGFRTLWASEFVPAAQEVYRLNHPGVHLDTRDIRLVSVEDVLSHVGKKEGEIDVLEGSPPCASFSVAGKRDKAWGEVKKYSDLKQRTDDLFLEFVRLLRGIQPKVFVAENVSGLVKGVSKGYFKIILSELKSCGYEVAARVLDAQWLGVPQARQRLIFVGVRKDLGIPPAHPSPLSYRYSIQDALPWISSLWADKHGYFEGGFLPVDAPAPTILASSVGGAFYNHKAEVDISRFAIGKEWRKLHPGEQSERYFSLIRADPDQPCPTITATGGVLGAAGVTHPSECRKFTIGELRRLCGFPDDFQLTGTYSKQWERLGRAVPPVMMSHVARVVRDEILAKIPCSRSS